MAEEDSDFLPPEDRCAGNVYSCGLSRSYL